MLPNTIKECLKAIERIEMNPSNVIGGSKTFFSGKTTYLTDKAKKKIAALEKRINELGSNTIDD